MKKDIWVLCNSRSDMIEAQRRVNESGGMRVVCMFSLEALEKAVDRAGETNELPSLLLVDYESGCREAFASVRFLSQKPAFAGIPHFFMVAHRSEEVDEKCYELGATVVLGKPLSDISVLRIERAAMQQEMTKSYEKILQKQTMELAAAKEISRLNDQLSIRNELLHQILGKYFSDEVVDVILEKPEGVAIGGEKRIVSVMMADLRGFTALSERLSADEVVSILNHYLSEMTEVILQYKGTIIEFIGDAVLVVFGAPLYASHSTDDAIAAAIEMQNRMEGVNRFNQENGYPEIEAGIGIHTGEAFIGNIGSEQFMRYNVIGQVVNLCSRVQTYSVGGQILLTHQALEMTHSDLRINQNFEISMKGIHEKLLVADIEGIQGIHNVQLRKQKRPKLVNLKQPLSAVLYLMQGKSVVKGSMSATIEALSDHEILVVCDEEVMQEFLLYQDTETVVDGENAYAKIMEIAGSRLRMHFTFMSENFLAVCGYDVGEIDV